MADNMTASVLTISKRIYDLLVLDKVTLGLQDVWYGDQQLLPGTPALCVEPGMKRRPLDGVPDLTRNAIDTSILIYHSQLLDATAGGQQKVRQDTIAVAEAVETWLHQNHLQLLDASGDRITIHSWVTEFDPGYAYKNGTLYHAVMMTWSSITKTRLRA